MAAKPAVINNLSQIVTDSEEKVVKKMNKYAAKRKEQFEKLCVSVRFSLSFCPKSSSFLLLYSVPTPISAPITTFISYSGSLAVLLSSRVPALVFCPRFLVVLLSYCVFILISCL